MTYSISYYTAWAVAVVGVIAGILAGTAQTPWHPSWVTNDVAATAGIISAICVGLAALLPQIGRTPGNREASYLKAAVAGELPKDIADKYPTATASSVPPSSVPPAG